MLDEERAALRAELDRLERELQALVAPLAPDAFHWQPDGGARWSVGQCVDHLASANGAYLVAFDRALAHGAGRAGPPRLAGAPSRLGRWFIGLQEPPPRRRLPAPRKIRPQAASTGTPAAIWGKFAASQQRARALLDATRAIEVDRIRFANPFVAGLPLFTVGEGLRIVAAHERRHLWQARRVAERPDFPGRAPEGGAQRGSDQ